MLGLSPAHLIIILVIALIVVGPGKLPEVGAAIGKSLREFQKATGGITDSLTGAMGQPPTQAPPTQAQTQAQPPAQSHYAAQPVYPAPVAPAPMPYPAYPSYPAPIAPAPAAYPVMGVAEVASAPAPVAYPVMGVAPVVPAPAAPVSQPQPDPTVPQPPTQGQVG